MSDALFTELSIEQQEVVAGGYYSLSGITDTVDTYYNLNTNKEYMNFLVKSGPGGSISSQQFVAESVNISTGASKFFNFFR
jgi:hypothetical protein